MGADRWFDYNRPVSNADRRSRLRCRRASAAGFTLIELLVVILIIGILAAIAVPQYFKIVEKGRVTEAMSTLDSIRSAQERYLSTSGGFYCTSALPTQASPGACTGFDIVVPSLTHYLLGAPSAGTNSPSWQVTITRNSPPPLYYGAYTITYDVEPGVPPSVSCSDTQCGTDLLP
ncbi:MAG: prepilin-type N-terminal cleavage/methylation domain-containing protein [Elusimicrobia bacterium]|nr:prepilin-type N-terminal cleavage/methylation domain-containing protein [Elusimicrobiota bacterium]